MLSSTSAALIPIGCPKSRSANQTSKDPETNAANCSVPARVSAHPVTFTQAALFQFLNPKAWVMTLTAATLFLPRELGALAAGAYMALIAEGIGVPCMAVWALFGSSLRHVIGTPRGRRVFNVAMALALATTAVMMVR